MLKDKFDYTPLATTALFTDAKFQKIFQQVRNADGIITFQKEVYFVSREKLMHDDMTLYAFTPITNMLTQYVTGLTVLLAVLFLMVLIILFSVKRETRQKVQAVEELLQAFKALEDGNLSYKTSITTGNEFEQIGQAYNKMVDSVRALIALNEEKVKATVISEVRQLESQFNPHFLFNTLENIKYMVRLDPVAASKMIVALSKLLRYSIDTTQRMVLLAEDLQYTHSYMQIQKYRYGERLHYKEDIEEEALNCLIPKLILQPVIENAIKYGNQNVANFMVKVSAHVVDDYLRIDIVDNGRGIASAQLKEIQAVLEKEGNDSAHHGLYNVHRRLQLIYGSNYGIKIARGLKVGTKISLFLPNKRL